jgi:hypothetical protein
MEKNDSDHSSDEDFAVFFDDEDDEHEPGSEPRRRGGKGGYTPNAKRSAALDARGAHRRTPIRPDGSCCKEKIDILTPLLMSALLTAQEKKNKLAANASQAAKKKGGGAPAETAATGAAAAASSSSYSSSSCSSSPSSALAPSTPKGCLYNRARLIQLLAMHAFDALGNPVGHLWCIATAIGVGSEFMGHAHREAVALSQNPVRKITKKELTALKLDDKVIVPEGSSHLTQSRYLKSLNDDDEVTVPGHAVLGQHGLAGKKSNHALKETQEAFILFVKMNRSSTGRTPDAHGRLHGAEYVKLVFHIFVCPPPLRGFYAHTS